MKAFEKISAGIRFPHGARFPAICVGILLWLIPASTPYGKAPLHLPCPSDTPPSIGWAVMWYPQETGFVLQAGRELLARAEYPAAACYLLSAGDGAKTDPRYLHDLGEAYWGAGEEDKAFDAWERALSIDPGWLELSGRIWKAYAEAGRWDDAERAIERYLSRAGEDPEAAYRLALIRAARHPGDALGLLDGLKSAPSPYGDNARTLAAVIRAALARRIPEYIFAKTGEALLRLKEYRLAEQALRLAVERNPEYGEAFALLGMAQEGVGDDPEESYRRAVALDPNSAAACLVYGAWLLRNGETTLARWWLLQAWAAKPGDWLIASELARLEVAAGDIFRAEEWVMAAVKANSSEMEAWLALAAFYIENDYRVEDGGIPAARQAVLLAPDSDRALDMLGWGWCKLHDFTMAERILRRALDINPNSASAHLHLGLCYAAQGLAAEAAAEWEIALALDSSGPVGQQAAMLLGG